MRIPALILLLSTCLPALGSQDLKLNPEGYFEMPGLLVTVFNDRYAEGHQGGITIIQNGIRVAANGDLRLEPAPGQWQPIPRVGPSSVDRAGGQVSVRCSYPDSSINGKGFNPVFYPDLHFHYRVRVKAEGRKVHVYVDLEEPLPGDWDQKVGFNLELYPGELFGKTWYLDGESGLFNTQANGPLTKDIDGNWQALPMAEGKKLTIAPDAPQQTMIIESRGERLQLLDGRFFHNNGWFVVRSLVSPGRTTEAVEWVIEASAAEGFTSMPVFHFNQVGYHPAQEKMILLELDRTETVIGEVSLVRFSENGGEEIVRTGKPVLWGDYLNFRYCRFDFTEVERTGIYRLRYAGVESEPFRIAANLFDRHVWQPTLEYWLPVQMCHMRVNEGYRVWHGHCHRDDARMAPLNLNHFDGYLQGPSTLTSYQPGEHVPGLDLGGWHDAGDYDLRSESQAGTVWTLSMIQELFQPAMDLTTIDQENHLVEIHRPDGRPDMLQQIEHGLLSLVSGYRSLGRMYRGIICPTLRQYVLLGDGSTMTDNLEHDPRLGENKTGEGRSGKTDDRWVFTEESPLRELAVAEGLAAGARAMKGYNDTLAAQALLAAEDLYGRISLDNLKDESTSFSFISIDAQTIAGSKLKAAVELFLATGKESYRKDIFYLTKGDLMNDGEVLAYLGRALPSLNDRNLSVRAAEMVKKYASEVDSLQRVTPYRVPYPRLLGVSWSVQDFGARLYFLHRAFPEVFDESGLLNALNFILGCHPGPSNASYVSGVGSHSALVAYGINRADGSFIPGGTVIGTSIIQPGIPEMKEWPFLWQQTEYVLDQPVYNCGGAVHFMLLVLAAEEVLKEKW